MIKEKSPKSLIEVRELLGAMKEDDKKKDLLAFIKKFVKLDKKKGLQMEEEIGNLKLLKLKKQHIVKIVDMLPEDEEDLNKIFVDVSLDSDETQKILEVVKKYK